VIHKVFIDGELAKTAQQVADAVEYAPERVRIESDAASGRDRYDGSLLALKSYSRIGFIARDGEIGEIFVGEGRRIVGVLASMLPDSQKGH
jgi:hypothetical protein